MNHLIPERLRNTKQKCIKEKECMDNYENEKVKSALACIDGFIGKIET